MNAQERKNKPLATGVLDYFPDALLAVAEVSRVGNEQHHPGAPLHWDKSKSTDEADALMRHLLDRGKLDDDGQRHSAKVAWRALALLQREIEADAVGLEELFAEPGSCADGTCDCPAYGAEDPFNCPDGCCPTDPIDSNPAYDEGLDCGNDGCWICHPYGYPYVDPLTLHSVSAITGDLPHVRQEDGTCIRCGAEAGKRHANG